MATTAPLSIGTRAQRELYARLAGLPDAYLSAIELHDRAGEAMLLARAAGEGAREAREACQLAQQHRDAAAESSRQGVVVTEAPVINPVTGRKVEGLTVVAADPKQLADAERSLADATAEVVRRQRQHEIATERAHAWSGLAANIARWLGSLGPDDRLAPYVGKIARTAPGDDLSVELAACQAAVAAKVKAIAALDAAPFPSTEVTAATLAVLKDRAATFDLAEALKRGRAVKPPTRPLQFSGASARGDAIAAEGRAEDAFGLLLWAFGDQIAAKLAKEIAAAADDKAAISSRDRRARRAALLAEKLAIERAEVEALRALQRRGSEVLPRPDIDPRAYLNLTVTTPPAAA